MVYREFDESQYLNKIKVLQEQIQELEEENKRLKHLDEGVKANSGADEALRAFIAKYKENSEIFMSQKEKKALKASKKTKMTSVANQLNMSHTDVERWKILAGIKRK